MALGVTRNVNTAELKGISGMEFVTKIDVFDEFHELATILLEASERKSETLKYLLEYMMMPCLSMEIFSNKIFSNKIFE